MGTEPLSPERIENIVAYINWFLQPRLDYAQRPPVKEGDDHRGIRCMYHIGLISEQRESELFYISQEDMEIIAALWELSR